MEVQYKVYESIKKVVAYIEPWFHFLNEHIFLLI